MLLALLMAAHIAGLILWFGATGAAAYGLLLAERKRNFDKDLDALAWDLVRGGLGGMFLVCFSGGALAALNVQYFTVQGWFKAKLFLVIIAGICTGIIFREARPQDDPVKIGRLRNAWVGLVACAALLLFLTTVRPF
jgi:uncharacterized membrane protein